MAKQTYIHVLKCDACGAASLIVNEIGDYDQKFGEVAEELRTCHSCGMGLIEYAGKVLVTP